MNGRSLGLTVGLLTAVMAVAVGCTWAFRAMRTVMDVGGTCASGGPYVSAQPCPEGAWTIGVAIPMLILAALAGSVLAGLLRAPVLLPIMWAALFGALGWNFWDYGLRESGNAGFIVCGVVFWLMALPAVLVVLFGGAAARSLRNLARGATLASAPAGDRVAWLSAYALVGAAGAYFGSGWWEAII